MESKAKIFGHPAHTILVVFPLGLLSTSVIFDGIAAITKKSKAAESATAMLGAGLIGGLAAAPWGTIDWLAIPEGTRAKKIGLIHGVGNALVMGLFGASWFLRRGKHLSEIERVPLALSMAGASLAVVTGWLGGELVTRLGVGVADDANLDAPNSLSDSNKSEPVDSTETTE